jgi:hypothetical protein
MVAPPSSNLTSSHYISAARLGNILLNEDDWAARNEELLRKAGNVRTRPA